MHSASLLDNISIVLVDTKTPANIGATARCMMNMGLSHLLLVRPPRDPLQQATKLAAGAGAILEQAKTATTLKEALTGYGLVFGASRHEGRLRRNIHSSRDAARTIVPLLPRNRVAVVFGNEVNGLTREDLAFCNEFIYIPSSAAFPSLNLSHAVLIVAYELFLASLDSAPPAGDVYAAADALEDFYTHLEKTLIEIEFFEPSRTDRMMFTLRQIFGRSRLSKRDVNILRGMLTAVGRAAHLPDK
jgi:TrmH family RNA methyltransferase